jgi:hypothetical protein
MGSVQVPSNSKFKDYNLSPARESNCGLRPKVPSGVLLGSHDRSGSVTMGGSRKPGDYPSITVLKGLVTDSPQFHSRVASNVATHNWWEDF